MGSLGQIGRWSPEVKGHPHAPRLCLWPFSKSSAHVDSLWKEVKNLFDSAAKCRAMVAHECLSGYSKITHRSRGCRDVFYVNIHNRRSWTKLAHEANWIMDVVVPLLRLSLSQSDLMDVLKLKKRVSAFPAKTLPNLVDLKKEILLGSVRQPCSQQMLPKSPYKLKK
jgi:hypothetical protein